MRKMKARSAIDLVRMADRMNLTPEGLQTVRILVRASNGMWRLPDGHPRIPLSFSLRAKKH
jgi:hypothetical protein